MCKTALFAHFLRKKCGFAHFWALFLELAEIPLFAQINYLAISALWLVLKFITLSLMGCFPVDFQEVKRPLRAKSGKRPIKLREAPH